MKKTLWTLMMLGLFALLLAPTKSWALSQDACTNNAVLRTTPSSDFTVIGDGSIVRHNTTRLEWQRCSLGQTWDGDTCTGLASGHNWQAALSHADAVGEDWRLPSINELRSIVEECRTSPAINRNVFPNAPSSHFWSASPYAGFSGSAWLVNFSGGGVGGNAKGNPFRVRLVRGGQ